MGSKKSNIKVKIETPEVMNGMRNEWDGDTIQDQRSLLTLDAQ